eukprot:UN10886
MWYDNKFYNFSIVHTTTDIFRIVESIAQYFQHLLCLELRFHGLRLQLKFSFRTTKFI